MSRVSRKPAPSKIAARFAGGGVLIALLTTVLVPTAHAATVNEVEDNGSTSTANVVALGNTVNGKASGSSTYDYDYFAFDVPSAGRAKFNFTFPSGLGTGRGYWVHVYNSAGNTLYAFDIAASDWDGWKLRSTATYVPAGRLYVRIHGSKYDTTWGQPYSLTTTVTAGSVETEFNNSTGSADLVALGKTVVGSALAHSTYDYDYFAFDVPSAGRARIKLTFPSGLGTGRGYWVHVYDSAGNTLYAFDIAASDWNSSQLKATAMYVPAGRLYVRIHGSKYDTTWGQPYSLTTTVKAGSVETEFNNSTATADLVALNTRVSGSALAHSTYDYDYYAVDISGSRKMGLKFTFPKGLGLSTMYDLHVYDDSGNLIYSREVSGAQSSGNAVLKDTISAPKGRVYVRVYGSKYYKSWGQPYSLTIANKFTKNPAVSIVGKAQVASTLTADVTDSTPVASYRYQWYRQGKAISGATASTYKLTAEDYDKNIKVKVTAKKLGYFSTFVVSTATDRVVRR